MKKESTSNKLTIEDCLRYHHSLIVEYNSKGEKIREYNNVAEFISVKSFDTGFPTASYEEAIKKCKLQLRSVDDLTEDEKEIIKNYETYPDIINDINTPFASGDIKTIDWCRDNGIDIDLLIKIKKAELIK